MGVLLLVVGILVVVGIIQVAVWVPVTRSWRKKSEAFDTELQAEMTTTGEGPIRGPESANYQGCSGIYGAVKGNGMLVLTNRRLLFRKRTGGVVEVPVDRITGTHQAKTFQGSRVGGRTFFVVETSDPAELGFFVDDLAAWDAAVTAARST